LGYLVKKSIIGQAKHRSKKHCGFKSKFIFAARK